MDDTLARISRIRTRTYGPPYAPAAGPGGKGNSVTMADLQEASLTLPSDPASVSSARGYVCARLAEWGLPPDAPTLDSVRLVVSELATNAVLHTSGLSPNFTVDMRLERGEHLHIGVTDSHPRWPQRLPGAIQQDNGRGMAIVRHLIAESGGKLRIIPTRDGGKTVWIMIPWTRPIL